jgi:4'-phosphopantetheinyl transferase
MRFFLGRALSRSLLGYCLGIPAESVEFAIGNKGKPSLAADFRQTSLNFNISHSGDFVLMALAYRRNVGIDIELVCRTVNTDAIAAQFLSKDEYARLKALPARLRHDAFYSCWTKKEAYLKARGDGLGLALNAFDVAFLPGEMPRLIETRHDPLEAHRWALHELDVGPNYKAALAIEGAGESELTLWDWIGWPN